MYDIYDTYNLLLLFSFVKKNVYVYVIYILCIYVIYVCYACYIYTYVTYICVCVFVCAKFFF